MMKYVVKRLIMALVVIYVVVSLSFVMVRVMPGSPMSAMQTQLQQQGDLTPAEIQLKVNSVYGLRPEGSIWRGYFSYVANAFRGDLGRPIDNPSETVVHVIASALPWTIFIVAVSLIISFLVGIALGTLMAAFKDTQFAKVATGVVSLLSAIPSYLVAIILLYLLTGLHHVFPSGGAYSVSVTPALSWAFIGSVLWYGILPVTATVIVSFGGWALAMKGSAISVLGAEYVRAAESRGLSGRRISQSYVGRNAMLPMVTSLALSLGFMFGGSVFIETYFTYPGIGYYLIQAVNSRDYSLMMGCFLLITVSVVVSNFLVDLLYPMVDPRIASPAATSRADDSSITAGEKAVPVGGSMA